MAKKPDRFSFSDWKFKTWVKLNKENLRLIVSGAIGIGTFYFVGMENVPYSASLGAISSALSKLALDSFDYYVSA